MAKVKLTLLALTILLATATFGSYKLGFHYYRAVNRPGFAGGSFS